jgi:hypothetical protein
MLSMEQLDSADPHAMLVRRAIVRLSEKRRSFSLISTLNDVSLLQQGGSLYSLLCSPTYLLGRHVECTTKNVLWTYSKALVAREASSQHFMLSRSSHLHKRRGSDSVVYGVLPHK